MADLLQIVDLADSGQVQLSLLGGSSEETAPAANFPFPLTDSELAEIRWFSADYPENTFGEAKTRAETVEAGLKEGEVHARQQPRTIQPIAGRRQSSGRNWSVGRSGAPPDLREFKVRYRQPLRHQLKPQRSLLPTTFS